MLAVKLLISYFQARWFFYPPKHSPLLFFFSLLSFIDAHHVSLQSLFLFGVGRERMTSRSEGQGMEKGREGGSGGIK